MKRITLFIAIILMCVQFGIAQTEARRSDRKIIELQKIITLTSAQETAIRNAYENYCDRNDSILYKVQNAAVAATLKRRSEMLFNQRLMNVLTAEQKDRYHRIQLAPDVVEKTKARIDELAETGAYTQAQLDSAKTVIYKQLMDEKLIYASEKYDYRKQKSQIAELKKQRTKQQPKPLRSDRKMMEIKKVISLSPVQEESIRAAYIELQQMGDSILFKVKDPAAAAELSYESNRKYHGLFMNALTDPQRNLYIATNSTPEVMAKARARVALLRETEEYSEAELETALTNIFHYLMLEKIVYERDKYDHLKQKENIAQLKKLEPVELKKANSQEKLKTQGKSYKGQTQW